MKLLNDKCLILPIEDKAEKKGGLLSMNKNTNKNIGEVIIKGMDSEHLKVGDIVQYHKNVGIPLEYNGIPHLILCEGIKDRPGDIIAIL